MQLQGYEADHRDIELLRLRSFTIGRSLKEEEIIGSDFMARVVGLMTIMEPFVSQQVVMSWSFVTKPFCTAESLLPLFD